MSSIGGIGGNSSMMMQGMRPMKRPDPAEMAENLFSKLDVSGQGYIEKSDLQAAFDTISSKASSASSTTSVDDMFSQLDTDSDGKVTKQEFSDVLKKVADELDNQAMSMRMNEGMRGGGGMPPPPPPAQNDTGFTKEELGSQLEEIGSTDGKRSALISSIVENFETADADNDGKVTFKEAMTYRQSQAAGDASVSGDGAAATASTSSGTTDAKLMFQIMRLMQAYAIGGESNGAGGSISVSA